MCFLTCPLAELQTHFVATKISTADAETPESRRDLFYNLLRTIHTTSASETLLTLLDGWSQSGNTLYLDECWRDILVKFAEAEEYELFLAARLSLPDGSILNEDVGALAFHTNCI